MLPMKEWLHCYTTGNHFDLVHCPHGKVAFDVLEACVVQCWEVCLDSNQGINLVTATSWGGSLSEMVPNTEARSMWKELVAYTKHGLHVQC